MSDTFAAQLTSLDQNVADITTAFAGYVSAVGTTLTNMQAQIAAGQPVTAAQVADMAADNAKLSDLITQMKADTATVAATAPSSTPSATPSASG